MHNRVAHENTSDDDDARILSPDMAYPAEWARRYQAAGYWQNVTLANQILDWQMIHSERIALIAEGRSWSYWSLICQARRFATALYEQGIRPGNTLLVQQPNGPDFVVALFAALLLGAVPVLMLPGHQPRDILHVAALARARLYLGSALNPGLDDSALAAALNDAGCGSLISRGDARFCGCQTPLMTTPPESDARHAALLLLSGGTTGLPKLIARTHADYGYNVRRCAELNGMDAADRYLAVLPMAHNFTLACPGVLGVWSQGGCVVVPDTPAPEAAFAAIVRHGVTMTALVPSLAQCWLDALPTERPNLRTLRLIQVGGAKLDRTSAGEMMTQFGCQLQQVYGMAEGLLCVTRLDDPTSQIVGTQGRPICPDDELRVMDAEGNPVAAGELGELWVRGPYTLRGYFRAQEYNRGAFSAEGFYRTGDRARLLPDGSLSVEGRIKDTINRHGESIAADDIERCLRAHPLVDEVAVIAEAQGEQHEVIHAVVVAKTPITLVELRAFLERQGVAVNKWPDRLSLVDAMPLTAIGKVNKKALSAQTCAGAWPHAREH